MLLTILAFIIVLGVLILVHELGHFVAAKATGVKVEEFAIGFPPRLLSLKRGETRYSINLIPFGGYVKMLGEMENSASPRAFQNQTPLKRFIISIAGVAMNILLAWVILTAGFIKGMSPLATNPDVLPGEKISSESVITAVTPGSVADQAGLRPGDVLLRGASGSDRVEFNSVQAVSEFSKRHKEQSAEYTYLRGDKIETKTVQLSDNSEAPLGIALAERATVKVAWYRAPYVALRETWEVFAITFKLFVGLFRDLFASGQVAEGVGGPVAVYVYSGIAFRAGAVVFLQLIAMLSINLALVNILPFPALDGGRLLFIALEKIRGKKVVREEVENIIHTIGFAILILLLLAITYRDIVNYFGK